MESLEQLGFGPFSPRGGVPNSNQGEIMSSEVSTRRLIAASMLLALAFTSLIQTGCTRPVRRLGIVDELAIAYRDRVWSARAYNLRFANCNREYSDHFKNGFSAGYSDICNGGDGYLPALPPEEYRGYEYQCAEGTACIDTWFEGYPAGVAAAREEKAGSYHEMHISRMIDQAITQDKATNILPSDVPVAKPSATLIPPKAGTTVATKHFRETAPSRPATAAAKTVATKPAAPKASASRASSPSHSVLAKPSAPVSVASKDIPKAVPVVVPKKSSVPPIVKAAAKRSAEKALPPIRSGSASASTPPIVQGSASSSVVKSPPIVRGRKIDPSANVSKNEIPLPMAVRSSFESRTAGWPINRR